MADMRAERTRRYLREALIGLLKEKPYTEVTVREVVERAQVSKNSFYNHYENLDTLVQDCYLQRVVYFSQPLKRLRDYTCRHNACTETLDERARILVFFRDNPNLARAILDNACASPYYEELRRAEIDLLLDHIDTEYGGAWLPFLSKENCSLYVVCGMYGLARKWFVDGMRQPIETVAKEEIYYALHTLAGMAGHPIEPEYLQAIEDWRFEA